MSFKNRNINKFKHSFKIKNVLFYYIVARPSSVLRGAPNCSAWSHRRGTWQRRLFEIAAIVVASAGGSVLLIGPGFGHHFAAIFVKSVPEPKAEEKFHSVRRSFVLGDGKERSAMVSSFLAFRAEWWESKLQRVSSYWNFGFKQWKRQLSGCQTFGSLKKVTLEFWF